MGERRRYDSRFKAQVALEAIRNQQTISQIASQYGVHPNQVSKWKKRALEGLVELFSDGKGTKGKDQQRLIDELYRQIGQLKVELDWLKKNLDLSPEEKKMLIEPANPDIPIYRQCQLLGVSRSSYYYKPAGESQYNLLLMRLIDEQYTKAPFYGVPRMTAYLRSLGHHLNHKRVERLMRKMALEGVAPKRNLSKAKGESHKYPYLLDGMKIKEPDEVWCSDITYIRMRRGYIYLVAVMDWFSRYLLSWQVSNTLDVYFCLEALERALMKGKPRIFNTDQGSQFTSSAFTGRLQEEGIQISMCGRGRVWDNIFIERLWRSVKWEEVYLNDYETVPEAVERLGAYFRFYNNDRLHQPLGYRTPYQVYMEGRSER